MSKAVKFINGVPQATQLVQINEGGTGGATATDARNNLGTKVMFNGIEDGSKFTLSYNEATRVFSVTYTSGAAVWVGGVRFPKSGSDTLTAHTNATNKYFFYYNTSGTLVVSAGTPWDLFVTAPLGLVYYNSGTAKGILFDERHPADTGMSEAEHRYNHLTRGTQTISGFAISGYTLTTAGATNLSYAIATGVIADEDLFHNISILADSGPYRVTYRLGSAGDWAWDDTSVTGILDNGTNLYWNQFTGGAWQLTPITANSTWVNYYVVVVPAYSGTPNHLAVMGQATYGTLALAQAEDPTTALSGFANIADEGVILYRLTYRRVSGSTPSNAQLVSVQTYRTNIISISGGFTPSDHQSLTNRTATDSHPDTAISVDATGFTKNLSGSNTQVHSALTTLDSHNHLQVVGTRSAPSDIVAGTGIAFSNSLKESLWFIQGSGGNVTISANPQVSAGSYVGQILTLIGRNDSQSVTLNNNNGLALKRSITLVSNSVLIMMWDGTLWCETERSLSSTLSYYDQNVLVTTEIGIGGTGYDTTHTVFTLPNSETYDGTIFQLEVIANGVPQVPIVDFNYGGTSTDTSITFTRAMPKNSRIRFRKVS